MFRLKFPVYVFSGFLLAGSVIFLPACSMNEGDTTVHPEVENGNADVDNAMDFGIEKHDAGGVTFFTWSKRPSQFIDLGHGKLKLVQSENAICIIDSDSGQNYGIVFPFGTTLEDNVLSFENGVTWRFGETAEQHNFFVKEPNLYNLSQDMKKSQQEIIKSCTQDNERIFFFIPDL
ncbi:hypothetical protein [uncultured Mobiluncus sp.]|uniref:hypothetical protein n=1 Tax=uncultured Mobiluncus sp. TaxID=293425 RepID=UPI002805A7AF|nr:hypothetical protein [uncultured Mobiluncus sp.]